MKIISEKINKIHIKCILLLKKHKVDDVKKIINNLKEKPYNVLIKNIISDIERKISLFDRFKIENNKGKKGLYLFIINKCDYLCIFCDRSNNDVRNGSYYTTLDDIKFIFGLNLDEKIDYICLGGHEPLANTNIINIVDYISKKGYGIEIFTSTSRPLILKQIIENYNILFVNLPKYGTTYETFDKITQKKGSFDNFKETIEILEKNNIKYNLHSPLIRQNMNDYSLFLDVRIRILLPNNIDTYNYYKNNGLNFSQLISFFKNIEKKYKFDMKEIFTGHFNLPLCILYKFNISLYNKIISYNREDNGEIIINKNSKLKVLEENNSSYVKVNKCNTCSIYNKCKGYYKIHFKVFGEDEVLPIN